MKLNVRLILFMSKHGLTLKHGWSILLVIMLAACLQALMPDSGQWLRFDRDAIQTGQYWRLLSGHVVHLGWGHYAMNMLGLILIVALYPNEFSPRKFTVSLLICALVVSMGLLLFSRNVGWYVGLSGVLHGLLVMAAVKVALKHARARRWESLFLLSLVAAKLLWEQTADSLPGSASVAGGQVVVDAHLYGALAGMGVALVPVVFDRLVMRLKQ